MSRPGLISIITRKEVTEMVRDGRLRLLSVFVGCLAITALVFGLQQALKEQHEREEEVRVALAHADRRLLPRPAGLGACRSRGRGRG